MCLSQWAAQTVVRPKHITLSRQTLRCAASISIRGVSLRSRELGPNHVESTANGVYNCIEHLLVRFKSDYSHCEVVHSVIKHPSQTTLTSTADRSDRINAFVFNFELWFLPSAVPAAVDPLHSVPQYTAETMT
jgi:hypothetical protein